ncbi:MAG: M28 family peptidase [Desulfobacterales bacterium]
MTQNEFEALPVSSEIMEIIQELCDMSGYGITSGIHIGEKGHTAARYIRDKLHAAGLKDAKLEPIKVNNPYPKHYEINAISESKETDLSESCFPIQWTAGTPKEGLSAELAYVGDGSVSQFDRVDVSGKIALIDEKFIRGYIASAKDAAALAKDKGAIAILRANMQVDSPQQQKREGAPEAIFPVPSFTLGKSCGDYLRDLAKSGVQHQIKIVLDVPQDLQDAYNVTFELPGSGRMEEAILVGTHYDTGYYTGAVDNNGSVALMIKLAQYFAAKPQSDRNRHMIFAWCMAHDFDLNSGHYQFADAHQDLLKKAIVWDVDHAVGGIRYRYNENAGQIVPVTGETCEFYIMSNNYTFTRLAAFSMDKYGFLCTQNRFFDKGRGPQWGMAPETCPWVNVASIPLYYHSIFDTPDKITLDQIGRAYSAHTEILNNVDATPEGFLFYDNNSQDENAKPPQVSIAIVSDTVKTGDTVKVWNDETRFYSEKAAYHYPAMPEWAGTVWDWGDGTDKTIGGPFVEHIYEKPGRYTITMTFTDTKGAKAIDTQDVTVLE